MPIKYNPSKKNTFNGYIDTAVSDLKKAKNMTSRISGSDFPDKTIIGRKFNKKGKIIILIKHIINVYTDILSVKSDVQETVNRYIKADNKAKMELNYLNVLLKVNNINLREKIKYWGLLGYSYDELDKMKYDDLNRLLGDNILKTPVIQNFKNPLDENNDPFILRRTNDMYILMHRIFNEATPNSVCQGGVYIGDGMVAYCDIDSEKGRGKLHIVVNNQKNKFNPTCDIISSIDINGHSNDITYIPENNIIIHPDHTNNEINLYQIDKKTLKITKIKTIKNRNADAIAYDSEKQRIIAINGTDAEVYLKNDYLSGDKQPISKFKVADKIKDTRDKEDCTYYNYRAGITAYNGVVYISYSGFGTDKEHYSYSDGDRTKSNLITALDYTHGGTAIGQIKDNIPQEVESIDHDEEGNLVYFSNYGPKTRVYISKLKNTNLNEIASNYKNEQKMKAKTVKKKQK